MAERFVVAGIQRTGTNYIRTLLDSHPDVLCIGEAFLDWYREPLGYPRFRRSGWRRRVGHWLHRRRQLTEYLDGLYGMPGLRAIGFKLMHTQLIQYPAVGDYLTTRRPKVMHVVRNNVLRTLVSRKLARARNLYHSREAVPPASIRLEPSSLIRELEAIDTEAAAWEGFLRGLEVLRVEYESMLEEPVAECRRMLGFLGVDADAELASPFQRVTSGGLEDLLENYDEVVERVGGTRYDHCLRPGGARGGA